MSRDGARWAVTAAAVVAAVAGALAVLTAAAIPAVVAGVASALVAVLVLAEDPEENGADAAGAAEPALAAPAIPPVPADHDDDVDPLQQLFESGPPAGGSGLLGAEFVLTTLRGRVAVARRALRPLSVVCFEVYDTDAGGKPVAPVAADIVGVVLKRTLREADVSGHLDGDSFVCILEDTGEDGAVWTAERVRRTLMEGGARRFRAGVASYPTHGLEPEELENKARAALVAARDWATDRIEVASAA